MLQKQVLRIVVASPSDVQTECDLIEEVKAELNQGIAAARGLVLEVTRWETDAFPGFHDKGPQALIDSVLHIEDSDLLIGIFWKRFGKPIFDAKSGTEYEFRTAYEAWKRNKHPQIMVYFNQKPYTPTSREEIEQWGQVLDFKSNFPQEGIWWSYNGKAEFEKLVRSHLTRFVLGFTTVFEPTLATTTERYPASSNITKTITATLAGSASSLTSSKKEVRGLEKPEDSLDLMPRASRELIHKTEVSLGPSPATTEMVSVEPIYHEQPGQHEQPSSTNTPAFQQEHLENRSSHELLTLAHQYIKTARNSIETASQPFIGKGYILPIKFKEAIKLLNTVKEQIRALQALLTIILSFPPEKALNKIAAHFSDITGKIYIAIEEADRLIANLENEEHFSRSDITQKSTRLIANIDELDLLFESEEVI